MEAILPTARTALAAFLLSADTLPAFAGAADYEFQPVRTELPTGPEAEFAVKIIDKRTDEPVSDAVIFSTRLDMAPDGMEMMRSTLDPLPSSEPGVYKFKLNLNMAGGWRFLIAAKIQGEEETAKGEIILQAIE